MRHIIQAVTIATTHHLKCQAEGVTVICNQQANFDGPSVFLEALRKSGTEVAAWWYDQGWLILSLCTVLALGSPC